MKLFTFTTPATSGSLVVCFVFVIVPTFMAGVLLLCFEFQAFYNTRRWDKWSQKIQQMVQEDNSFKCSWLTHKKGTEKWASRNVASRNLVAHLSMWTAQVHLTAAPLTWLFYAPFCRTLLCAKMQQGGHNFGTDSRSSLTSSMNVTCSVLLIKAHCWQCLWSESTRLLQWRWFRTVPVGTVPGACCLRQDRQSMCWRGRILWLRRIGGKLGPHTYSTAKCNNVEPKKN